MATLVVEPIAPVGVVRDPGVVPTAAAVAGFIRGTTLLYRVPGSPIARVKAPMLSARTRGSLNVPRLQLWRYEGAQDWGAPLSRRQLDVIRADPLVRQISHFCRVIRDDEAWRVPGEDAMRTLACATAAHQAAASGATADVDAVLTAIR